VSITTFASLIATPNTHKIILAQLTPAEDLQPFAWVQESSPNTDVWRISYLNESVTLTSGDVVTIRKAITGIKADGTSLTLNNTLLATEAGVTLTTEAGVELTTGSSIANVQAAANSYWHDIDNGLLYVNVGGDPTVVTSVLKASFNMYFATEGIALNNVYWEPYLLEVPSVRFESMHLHSGYAVTTTGTIVMANNDGYWNVILDKFLWFNQPIKIYFGGEDLPFSEYDPAFTGRMQDKEWDETRVNFRLKDSQLELLRSFPDNLFDTSTYPNMDASSIGNPIPLAWGTFTSSTAPIVTAINESYATNKVQYKICDHAIFSLDGVQVSHDGGITWATVSSGGGADQYGTVDLTLATFIVDFTTNGYTNGQTLIRAAFKGVKNADSTQMTFFSDYVKDILQTHNSFVDADLNLPIFATSKTDSVFTGAIYLNKVERTIDVIDKICRSDLARFYVNRSGQFEYEVLNPVIDSTAPMIDRSDLLSLRANLDTSTYSSIMRIGYSYDYAKGSYTYTQQTDSDALNKYDRKKSKTIDTYLDNQSDAIILAQRELLLRSSPFLRVSGKTKFQLAQIDLGHQIRLTSSRAPFKESAGYASRVFILTGISKNLSREMGIEFEANDLHGISERIGFWTDTGAPVYTSATDVQKQSQGFWTDSVGRADPADATSVNKSVWW